MSFEYSSSSCGAGNRVFGFQADRPRQGLVKWSESHECWSGSHGLRGGRFGDHLMIKDGESDRCREVGPTSGIEEAASSAGGRPPSPSPICSPSNSCSPVSSPTHVDRSARSRLNEESDSRNEGSTVSLYQADSRGKRPLRESQSIRRPDPSPSRSDDGSFARLAANIYTNQHSRPASENPEDESNDEEVREIHIMEDRSRSTANISNHMSQNVRRPRQPNWSDTSLGSYISSDAESISLSTEFNNVLAAAAAAGTNSSAQAASEAERLRSILEERTPPRRSQLPRIGEEEPARTTNAEEADLVHEPQNRRDEMALVLSTNDNSNTTPGGQERNRDQRGGRDCLALVPTSGTHESGSTSDRDAPSSSWDGQNNESAMVSYGESENRGGSHGSESSSARHLKDVPTPKQLALAKVKRDKIEAKAVAWEEARSAEVENRFKREEAIIVAWENEQKVKASIKMKTVERKLEERRAKAHERMQNEIARAHQKAEERRAIAEARKGAQKAKIAEAVDQIRSLGRLPRRFLLF